MNIKLETPRDTCEMRQSQQEEQDQSQTTSDWTPIDRTGDARRSVTFDSTALDEESSREVPELNGKLTKLEPRIAVGASIYGVFLRKSAFDTQFAHNCTRLHSYLLAILLDIIQDDAFSICHQL